jgi:hypothetical protein
MAWEIGGTNPPGGVNLVSNFGFETNTTGWTPQSGATLTRSTTTVRTGAGSGYVTYPRPSSQTAMDYTPIAVTPGETYVVSAWAKSWLASEEGTGPYAAIEVNFYRSDGSWIEGGASDDVLNSSSTWTEVTDNFVAPTDAATMLVTLWNSVFGGTLNASCYWDDISVVAAGASAYDLFIDDARYFKAVGSIPYTRINTSQSPALGAYTTTGDLLVAEFDDPNNKIQVRRISPEDMATVVATFNSAANAGFGGPLAGVLRGNFDFPEERYIFNVQGAGGSNWWPFKNSDGTYMSGDAFPVITGGNQGIAYDGTNFWALGSDGNLYKHTNIKWTNGTDSAAWASVFTWYDGASQETNGSTATSFTMKMRARLTVTSPALPYLGAGDPDRIRVYVGRGGGTKYLQATSTSMTNFVVLSTATFSGTAVPGTNTFASATPAKIRNTDDSLIISADGSVKVKSLTVTDGSPMTMQVFTSSGTWTKPAGCRTVKVRVQGGGGAGGGSDAAASGQNSKGSGGGGGGYAEKVFAASALASSITVTVGSGGTGAAGANGNSGTNSSFAHTTAVQGNGGGGGANASTGATPFGGAGGGGGTSSGGDVNTSGGAGGMAWGDALLGISGPGGSAHMGGGGAGRGSATAPASLAGFVGGNYGGGGGGALSTSGGAAAAGGNGANGVVIVECYF